MIKSIIFFFVGVISLTLGATEKLPFEVCIVPHSCSEKSAVIHWNDETQSVFYVVLTNVSEKSQPVFTTSNSWGYDAISFEVKLPDGSVSQVALEPGIFTRNIPSTNHIPSHHIQQAMGEQAEFRQGERNGNDD